MTRDLLSNRIKKTVCPMSQFYMERFYVYNNKIFQIVRFKRDYSLVKQTYLYVLTIVEYTGKRKFSSQEKTRRILLTHEEFENRKFYFTAAKAIHSLKK